MDGLGLDRNNRRTEMAGDISFGSDNGKQQIDLAASKTTISDG